MVAAFFTALHGSSSGWVPVMRYPPAERTSGKPWADMDLNETHWFRWPQQQAELVEFCEAHANEDLSTTVAVCTERNIRKESIPYLNVIHCDADGAAPSRFAREPSMILQSSPGRYQLYWLLKDPAPRSKVEPVAKAVAYSQREWGADLGWAANKLLRVPGTTNTKPAYKDKKGNSPKVSLRITGKVYTLKELKKAFNAEAVANPLNVHVKPFPDALPKLPDVLGQISPTSDFMQLYSEPATPTQWNPTGSRYKVLYKLACQLFRAGHSAPEVFVVCANSASNKYEQDNRNELELWRDVLKAEADVEANSISFFEDVADGEVRQFTIETQKISLLTDEERAEADKLFTFVDRYCDWAKTRAKLADMNYHIANGITVLSTALSEFGFTPLEYGSMNLEIWFMVLGLTTRSYKTTAAKLMLHVLDYMQTMIHPSREHPYLLASDPTPQALTQSLALRGETSSIFHVDEAHGMISAEKGGGNGYMSGMIRLLTQLHDGVVPAVDRVTRDSTPATRTHVTMNLLGVPGKMVQTLHQDDFASGFLARFIFVLGTPAPDDRDSMYLKQGSPFNRRDHDPIMDELAFDLANVVGLWRDKAEAYDDGRVPIVVEHSAWERWNRLNYELSELSKQAEAPEAALPTARRTALTALRLACLFAMHEGQVVVGMKHLLKAATYAEQWYATMLQMISMVHQNDWARQVSELVGYVTASGRISYNLAYRHFANYKPREFEDLVNSALATGRLRRTLDGRTQYLEPMSTGSQGLIAETHDD